MKNNPVDRLRTWLQGRGWWDTEREARLKGEARSATLRALVQAEQQPKTPPLQSLFDDVYDRLTPNLQQQKAQLSADLRRASEDARPAE